MQEIFIESGWEVAMVTTQAEGLMLLRDYDPDWIIVAWEQLEGTGERFMREVQLLSPWTCVAILMGMMSPVERAMSGPLRRMGSGTEILQAEDPWRSTKARANWSDKWPSYVTRRRASPNMNANSPF